MKRNENRHSRSAFTLVEILVVVGIMLLLMSLSASVLRGAITSARQRQTEATILKLHGLIQQRIDAFNRAMDHLNLTPVSQKVRQNFNSNYAGPHFFLTDSSPVLTPLARKQLFQSRFPQNFAERNLSTSATLPPPSPHQPVTQSSALLYWILTNTEVFGIPPVDPGEFTSAEVRDTDGDGLNEFIDGWGKPLRYYRWPTQLFRPGGIGTGATANPVNRLCSSALWSGIPPLPANVNDIDPLSRDPDDPTSQIYLVGGSPGTPVMTAFEDLFNTPSTYHAFLIMSAGPDGVLGLHEPFDYFGRLDATGTQSDPTQVPPPTTTWQSLQIPLVTSPVAGTSQGRLAAVINTTTLSGNPINDNITNRKR